MDATLLPLACLMGSADRIVVRFRRPDTEEDALACWAGELADADPDLPTFRAPELAQLLRFGSWEAAMVAHAAKVAMGAVVEVERETVSDLLSISPPLTAPRLQELWDGWSPEQRETYKRLRRAALVWLGLREDGQGNMNDRLRAASWAADRVGVLH